MPKYSTKEFSPADRQKVPVFPKVPENAVEGDLLQQADVIAEINGRVGPVTVSAEVIDGEPHLMLGDREEEDVDRLPTVNALLGDIGLSQGEIDELPPEYDELSDDHVRKLVDQIEKEAPLPEADEETEVLGGLGRVAASEMIGGVIVGVHDKRIEGMPVYEPATTSYIPEIARDPTDGEIKALVRVFPFEDDPEPPRLPGGHRE